MQWNMLSQRQISLDGTTLFNCNNEVSECCKKVHASHKKTRPIWLKIMNLVYNKTCTYRLSKITREKPLFEKLVLLFYEFKLFT